MTQEKVNPNDIWITHSDLVKSVSGANNPFGKKMSGIEAEACILYFVHDGYLEKKVFGGVTCYRRTSKMPEHKAKKYV